SQEIMRCEELAVAMALALDVTGVRRALADHLRAFLLRLFDIRARAIHLAVLVEVLRQSDDEVLDDLGRGIERAWTFSRVGLDELPDPRNEINHGKRV